MPVDRALALLLLPVTLLVTLFSVRGEAAPSSFGDIPRNLLRFQVLAPDGTVLVVDLDPWRLFAVHSTEDGQTAIYCEVGPDDYRTFITTERIWSVIDRIAVMVELHLETEDGPRPFWVSPAAVRRVESSDVYRFRGEPFGAVELRDGSIWDPLVETETELRKLFPHLEGRT